MTLDAVLADQLRRSFRGEPMSGLEHESVRLYLDAAVPHVVDAMVHRGLRPSRARIELSAREREALVLAGCGLTAHGIGRTMHLSHRTVKAHLGSARRKLHAANTTHAVVLMLMRRP